MSITLSDYCIYAALKKSRLEEFEKIGFGQAKVDSKWVQAEQLIREAAPARLSIIFSDAAADMVNLIYWGLLSNIKLLDDGTIYQFDYFSALKKGHKTQDLVLKSTNKTIADNFIHSYAICLTPGWLRELAERLG